MLIDLSKYDKYLIPVESGLGVIKDCPEEVLKELRKIDKNYFDFYGEHLIHITNKELLGG